MSPDKTSVHSIGCAQIAYPKLIEKYVGGELVVLGTDGSGILKNSGPEDGDGSCGGGGGSGCIQNHGYMYFNLTSRGL